MILISFAKVEKKMLVQKGKPILKKSAKTTKRKIGKCQFQKLVIINYIMISFSGFKIIHFLIHRRNKPQST